MWSSISMTLRKLAVALVWFGMLVIACRGEPDESGDATEFRGGNPPQGLDNEVESLRVVGMTMTASSEVGTIPGAASVGPTGQAGYSIPIEVPPGAGGLAPSLALQYGSGGGNGSFGLGWGLVGFSAIDRCAKTIADDGAFSPVEFDGDDALCLDGKRLVLYAGAHLQAGAEYRTKRDPFERIRILNYGNQPYFEVESRDGRISMYGFSSTHSQHKNGVKYTWLLESVRDRSGNQINYWYEPDGASGTPRPSGVNWQGGQVELVADPAGREDERRGFHFGEPWAQLDRIERIVVKGLGGELLYTYELDYQYPGLSDPPEPWQSATRSLLTSIEKCDAAGACLPATDFYYSATGTDIVVAADELPGMPDGIEYLSQAEHESLEWNRKSIVGDFNGDRAYEALIWNPEQHGFDLFEAGSISSDELVFGLYWPSYLPPSWEDTAHQLDAAARAGADDDEEPPYAYTNPFGQPLWRVRPSMGYAVVNYDNDSRDDILYPVGSDQDAWGIGYADEIWIATQGSDFTAPGAGSLDFAEVVVDDQSSDPIYNVVPVDHDGNGLTDFWMCRGQGFKSSHWVLALNQGDTHSFTFSFHDSNVGCSIHDELEVIPLRGGADSLLVVPAYAWEPDDLIYPQAGDPPQVYVDAVPPLGEATRTHYLELRFDPSSGQDGELVSTDLPRDLFQRWRDRNCSNGNAVSQGGPPVFGAGLSLDRQVDLNGDGYLDIVRAELAVEPVGFPAGSADTHANIDAIQNNLGAGWGIGGTCQPYNPAIDHEDVALRGWINTGDGFERGDVLYYFSGNPHANLWANIVGGQLTDRDRDGFADLLVPSTGVGGDWTILKGSGDVFDCAGGECFEAESITLPAGWPGYRSDATWKGDVHRGSVVQLRSVGGIAFEGADDYGSGPVRSVDYLAYGLYQGVGMRLVRATDGLGGAHEFFYDCAHEDSVPPALGTPTRPRAVPRTCLPVVKSHTTPGGQTIRYAYGDAVVDQHGRGFLGFDAIRTRTTSDFYDEIEVLTEFDFTYDPTLRDYPRAGLPSRTRTSRALGNPQPLFGSRADVECTDITEWQVMPQTVSGGTTWFSYAAQTHTYGAEVTGSVHGNDLPSCDDLGPFDRESFTEQTRNLQGTVTLASRATVDGEEVTVTSSQFVNDAANWFIGRPQRIEVESCIAGNCATRTTSVSYDAAKHRVMFVTREPDSVGTSLFQNRHFLYNVQGRVQHIITNDSFGHARLETIMWDALGRLPIFVTNAEGHTSYVVHDEASGVLWATVAADGLTSITDVDGFYRPAEVRMHDRPFGPSAGRTEIEYLAGPEPTFPADDAAMRVRVSRLPYGQRVTTEIDSAGREIRRRWKAAPGTESFPIDLPDLETQFYGDDIYVDTTYDLMSRPTLITHPQVAPQNPDFWTIMSWDAFGRVTTQGIGPWNSQEIPVFGDVREDWHYVHDKDQISSDGRPVSVYVEHEDADHKKSGTMIDPDGRVTATRDALGTLTCFDYGPFGVLERVHRNCESGASGPTAETEYTPDAIGRIVAESDPAFGKITTTYTGFDEVDVVTDELGIAVDTDYDDLGRPISRDENGEGITTWDWDTHRLGHVFESTSADGVIRRFYNGAFGRLAAIYTTAPTAPDGTNPQQARELFTYSIDGRLTSIEFDAAGKDPNFKIDLAYDEFANLRSVHRASTGGLYWGSMEIYPAGQIKKEGYGNGVITENTYEEDTFRMQKIRTVAPDTPLPVQDLNYEWSPAGDLLRRDNTAPEPDQFETFGYDDLHRLTQWRPNGATQSAAYDVLGNFTSKAGAGTFTYDGSGRLDTTSNPSTSYDFLANGNLSTWGSSSLTWTPLDKVRTLTSPSESFTYRYDADGTRTYRSDGEVVYFTPSELFERRIEDGWPVVHYRIPTADGRIAAEVRFTPSICNGDNCSWTTLTRYLHDDHLGSSSTITRSTLGSVVGGVSYDPWGRPRNPANWKQYLTAESSTDTLITGFTGHQPETEGGLINMRGRVYDPRVGRFASVDPIVSDPTSSQGWNPYSYVGNQPLKYTDPSGYYYPEGAEPPVCGSWGNVGLVGVRGAGGSCGGGGGGGASSGGGLYFGGSPYSQSTTIDTQFRNMGRAISAGFAGIGGGGVPSRFNGPITGGGGIPFPYSDGTVRSGGGGGGSTLVGFSDTLIMHLALAYDGPVKYKALGDFFAERVGGTDPEIPKLNGWVEYVLTVYSLPVPGLADVGVGILEASIGVAPAPTALDVALLLIPGKLGKFGLRFRKFTRRNFRHNLTALTGREPANAHAHHVFPVEFKEQFKDLGIRVNNPLFGAWWEASDHLSNAKAYNAAWVAFFRTNPSPEQAVEFGRKLAGRYGFTIYF